MYGAGHELRVGLAVVGVHARPDEGGGGCIQRKCRNSAPDPLSRPQACASTSTSPAGPAEGTFAADPDSIDLNALIQQADDAYRLMYEQPATDRNGCSVSDTARGGCSARSALNRRSPCSRWPKRSSGPAEYSSRRRRRLRPDRFPRHPAEPPGVSGRGGGRSDAAESSAVAGTGARMVVTDARPQGVCSARPPAPLTSTWADPLCQHAAGVGNRTHGGDGLFVPQWRR